jgi:hypothetical protein
MLELAAKKYHKYNSEDNEVFDMLEDVQDIGQLLSEPAEKEFGVGRRPEDQHAVYVHYRRY